MECHSVAAVSRHLGMGRDPDEAELLVPAVDGRPDTLDEVQIGGTGAVVLQAWRAVVDDDRAPRSHAGKDLLEGSCHGPHEVDIDAAEAG